MTVAVCVKPPPVPVTVIVCLPFGVPAATAIVITECPEPGAAMDLGLKVTVTPLPSPDADKEIAESKPPETAVVILTEAEAPASRPTVVGDAVMVKLAADVTVRVTVVVSTMLPEVPVTVIVYVPAATDEPTVSVSEEVPAPVIEVGLKTAVTPVGWPLAVKVIAESNPPVTALVMVELAEPPATTVRALGEAEMLKPAVGAPARARSRLSPFGLPQPVDRS